ncbi:MAG TPA: hypothetical protein VFD30_21340 [Terriglobia bacterium]|nr:hypothetical protein [Terriglobia bacterium]
MKFIGIPGTAIETKHDFQKSESPSGRNRILREGQRVPLNTNLDI